jgi:hypothetical protein
LDAKTVLDYVFLAHFDLLQDSRHNVQEKPWSCHAEQLAMNTWYKIQQSREKLQRAIVEAKWLRTWIHDEELQLGQCIAELTETDPLLCHQVQKLRDYCTCINAVHAPLLDHMECSKYWTGPCGMGCQKGRMAIDLLESEVVLVLPDVVEPPRASEDDSWVTNDEDNEDEGVDPGGVCLLWDTLADKLERTNFF